MLGRIEALPICTTELRAPAPRRFFDFSTHFSDRKLSKMMAELTIDADDSPIKLTTHKQIAFLQKAFQPGSGFERTWPMQDPKALRLWIECTLEETVSPPSLPPTGRTDATMTPTPTMPRLLETASEARAVPPPPPPPVRLLTLAPSPAPLDATTPAAAPPSGLDHGALPSAAPPHPPPPLPSPSCVPLS